MEPLTGILVKYLEQGNLAEHRGRSIFNGSLFRHSPELSFSMLLGNTCYSAMLKVNF